MADTTTISWSDRTWSPWYGCTQVSMGDHGACVGCYARFLSETRQKRVVFGGPGRGEGTRDARADSAWKDPLRWDREQAAKIEAFTASVRQGIAHPSEMPAPCFVFPSMCDPFDNHPDLPPLLRRFMDLMRATPHLTYLLLTKRPGNIVKLFLEAMRLGEDADDFAEFVGGSPSGLWPRNAAIGCTVVTQEEADRDIPKLLAAKAALNPALAFVSMEPLLGPVDLTTYPTALFPTGPRMCCSGHECGCMGQPIDPPMIYGLDWVITGGETNQGSHRARPSHPDWFRSLRDQCAAAGVPFHHKQNGEWAPGECGCDAVIRTEETADWFNDRWAFGSLTPRESAELHVDDEPTVYRLGKNRSGRTLDGVTHDARPEVRS